MPFFSLVISTMGRSRELKTLFGSLARQSFSDFEVVLVDQNDNDDLETLTKQDWGFPLTRIACPQDQGLSKGRNVGWRAAGGVFICFPDDDCWYDGDFLASAYSLLSRTKAEVLTGRAAKEDGRDLNGRFSKKPMWVTKPRQVWMTQIEWVAFFKHSLLLQLGGYDEKVGIGASTPWQACEGQEIVLRALEADTKCYYDPALVGRHAEIVDDKPDARARQKALGYARGMGYVLRKHHLGALAVLYWVARPLLRSALMLILCKPGNSRFYASVALGRFEGALDLSFRS